MLPNKTRPLTSVSEAKVPGPDRRTLALVADVTPSGRNTRPARLASAGKGIFTSSEARFSGNVPLLLPRKCDDGSCASTVKLPAGVPGKLKRPSGPVETVRDGVSPSLT